MSARDDYPMLARLDKTNYVGIGAAESVDVQARNALDEIDRLRAAAVTPEQRRVLDAADAWYTGAGSTYSLRTAVAALRASQGGAE